jgi:protein kinase C substrate 80K-H
VSRIVVMSVRDDDFCDDTGDEETSTSACSYWTVGQRTFICKRGSTKSLFASRVSDGFCDCCDGSDEAGAGLVVCPDTCAPET